MCQLALISCGQQNNTMNIDDIKLFQKELSYPYYASEKREKVISDNMNKLEKGMRENQVIELMSSPDEVNLTYKSIKSKSEDNVIGFSMVYLLRRNIETGSVNEKEEKLIRIHFDGSGVLLWSFSIDFDEFRAIEKD